MIEERIKLILIKKNKFESFNIFEMMEEEEEEFTLNDFVSHHKKNEKKGGLKKKMKPNQNEY